MAKMWAGRFSKETDPGVNDFNSSIAFDARMYRVDIRGSMAHAAMLGKTGIISEADAEAITEGLKGILHDLDSGALAFDPNAEDIHMFVEAELTARIGDPGKRLHTARSRNDQVAVDLRLYLREEIDEIIGLLKTLGQTVVEWQGNTLPPSCRGIPTSSGPSRSPSPTIWRPTGGCSPGILGGWRT